MEKLDKVDLKILKLLQENSKITNLELSKRIGLSPAPTLERVKKLEASGHIVSYHALVNTQLLGLNFKTFVFVNLDYHTPNAMNSFIEKMKNIPEVTACYLITGEADLMLQVICSDLIAYEQIIIKKIQNQEEVGRVKTSLIISTPKESKLLPYNYD